MEEQLFAVVASAIACAPIVAGITSVFKKHTQIMGIEIILTALTIGLVLFGSVAFVFSFPLAESLLAGVLTGFASVGAFEGFEHAKEFIE